MQVGPVSISQGDLTQGVYGGTLIAAASTLNYLVYGRLTGISGMLGTVRTSLTERASWQETFLTGLVAAGIYAKSTYGDGTAGMVFFEGASGSLGFAGWALSGLLVGVGTKLGNGCTSGHGVCGLPRLSARSWAATAAYCATGFLGNMLVAPLIKDLLAAAPMPAPPAQYPNILLGVFGFFLARTVFAVLKSSAAGVKDRLFTFATGLLFGSGLVVSGMLRPSKVKGFLTLDRGFDAQLVAVLGTVVAINLVTFTLAKQRRTPVCAHTFSSPMSTRVDRQLLTGAALFGLGWGLCGVCPGPGLIAAFATADGAHMSAWLAAFFAGQILAEN